MSHINYFGSSGSSSSNIQTITGNSGGAVGPTSNNVNLVGSGVITVTGNPGTSTLTISGGAAIATQYDADSGSAVPLLGVLNVNGDHGLNTLGAGNTLTIAVDNTLTLGDLSAVASGSDSLTLTTGDLSIVSGNLNLPTTADANNGVIEVNSARFIHSFGTNNSFFGSGSGNFSLTGVGGTGVGVNALAAMSDGGSNTAVGHNSSRLLNGGDRNTSLGAASLETITIGTDNIAVGYSSGSALATTDSNNITIGHIGVAGNNNRIRIGTNGSQTSTFIAGIDGVNVGSVAKVLTMASDQLGTATITAGTNITITPGANTITIDATADNDYTIVSTSTTPYVALSTDQVIDMDSTGGAKQVNLPNAPVTGKWYTVKDGAGTAVANNITVTTVGGVVLIDSAATFVMNSAYESATFIFNGTKYLII